MMLHKLARSLTQLLHYMKQQDCFFLIIIVFIFRNAVSTEESNAYQARPPRIHGFLLLSGRSRKENEPEQTGGRNLLSVRWRGKRGRHEDSYEILLCTFLLEVLESHYMHILRSHSSILPIERCFIDLLICAFVFVMFFD